jgi:predicted O-linked N-acetylglucosamine transferase (SPINDLY family)
LRVGYVSGDFYAHPVGWLGVRTLTAHDREAVEVHCYANQTQADFLTSEIRAGVEHWHEVRHLSDAELRGLILSHGIDVLVDLGGHTASNRLPVFARRAAPVQLSWLGYTGSTGIAAIDGVLLGEAQAPPGTQEGFVEPVLTLPRCHFTYRPPDYAPAVAQPPAERNGWLTLGSFNNPAKLNAGVLRVWAETLRTLPNSRLVLKWRSLTDPALAARLRQQFALLDIEPERIELRGASTHAQMLAEYGDIDIALDPFPFCGGLTTCEALWMGVPVVTLPWRRPVSRQGHAILDAIGLADLSADTPREYVATVRRLAMNIQRRAELRSELRDRMRNSALFDGASLARALESTFWA